MIQAENINVIIVAIMQEKDYLWGTEVLKEK